MKKIHLKQISLLVLMTLIYAGLFAQKTAQPFADYYISTTGNDAWSGKLAEPNAAKTDGPFATVNRAKQVVKFFKQGVYRDIFVMIRGGQYRLSETETFTSDDSHYDSYKINYMAFPGEEPVFHSDIEITGWKLAGDVSGLPDAAKGKVYVAQLPKLPAGKERFYTLYDNGELQTRARSKGFEPTKPFSGGDGGGNEWKGMVEADRTLLRFDSGALKNWPNL
ncbi:hypothetical protein JZU61_06680, partial [bacterium]|nr:hypothetical protein [bacterium]